MLSKVLFLDIRCPEAPDHIGHGRRVSVTLTEVTYRCAENYQVPGRNLVKIWTVKCIRSFWFWKSVWATDLDRMSCQRKAFSLLFKIISFHLRTEPMLCDVDCNQQKYRTSHLPSNRIVIACLSVCALRFSLNGSLDILGLTVKHTYRHSTHHHSKLQTSPERVTAGI